MTPEDEDPEERLSQPPSWIALTPNRPATNRVPREPARPSVRSAPEALPPGIVEFTVSPASVAQGEGFVATVRGTPGLNWGRFQLAADANHNGRYDAGVDVILHEQRGRGSDRWSVQVTSKNLDVGLITVFGRLLYYDGTATPWAQDVVEIFQNPTPDELPATIVVPPPNAGVIVPYRNGDALLGNLSLTGEGQINFYELAPRNTLDGSNFRIWTTGGTDTVVGVYDTNGNRIALDDNNGPGDNGEVLVPLQTDTTYYVAIAGRGDAIGSYGIEMSGINQTLTASIAVPPGGYAGTASDSVNTSQRVDYFRVHAPESARFLTVTLDVEASVAAWVRVEDDEQNVYDAGLSSRTGHDITLNRIPVSGERDYFVTVFGMYGSQGQYVVNVDFAPDQIGFSDSIPLPAWGQYTPLVVLADGDAKLEAQSIGANGEYLFYKLSPGRSGTYTVRTTGSLDTQLALYRDGALDLVTWNDDGGAGRNASLTFDTPGITDYWVAVSASQAGVFDLELVGDDQFARILVPAGLSREAKDKDSARFVNSGPQYHYTVTAPSDAQSMTVTVTPVIKSDPGVNVDVWFVIENEQGIVSEPANSGSTNIAEQIVDYPVVGGQQYWISLYAWQAHSVGNADVLVDFDPDVGGSGELPINSSTFENQRNPDVAVNASGNSVMVWSGHGQGTTYGNSDDDIYFQRFDNQGQPVGGESKANAPDADVYQGGPAVGIDDSGKFVISWVMEGRVYYRRFSSAGAPLTAELDALGKPDVYYHDIAVQSNGAFMVVGSDGDRVWGRLFNGSGNPITSVFAIDITADQKSDPSVAADGQGNYTVSWRSRSDDGRVRDIFAARFDSNGNSMPSGRNTYVPGRVEGVRFDDANQNGTLDSGESPLAGVTVFLDANGNGLREDSEPMQITDADGRYTFDNVPVGIYRVVQSGGDSSGPAVVGDDFNRADSSDLGPAWTEVFGDMRIEDQQARASGDESLMLFNDFQSADQTIVFDVFYDSDRGNRAVNASAWLGYTDSSNNVKLTVQDGDRYDGQLAFYRTYWGHGATTQGRRWPRFKGADSYLTDIASFESARILVRYDVLSSTVTLGIDPGFDGVFDTVLTRGGLSPDGLGLQLGLGGISHVALDNFKIDPNYVVVPPPSVSPDNSFEVSPEHAELQDRPATAAADDDSFVVAYEVAETDGSQSNVYLRRFDNFAQPLGPPLRVHQQTTGEQGYPAVAVKDDGEVIVAWESNGQLGTGSEVYFRHVDASGNLIGLEETLLNDYTTADQDRPAVAGNGGDWFGFAWESDGQDTSVEGIFGRFLDLPTPTPAPLLLLTTPGGGNGPAQNGPGTNGPGSSGPQIDFGLVPHAADAPSRILRVTNRGSANLTGTASLTGTDAARFELLGAASFDLAPGAAQDLVVSLKTDLRGPFDAQILVVHNASPDPALVSLNAAVVPNPDRFESNETPLTATDLGTLRELSELDLSLHNGQDQDWYQFQVPLLSTLQIDVTHLHAEGDLDMVLYDDELDILAASSTISDNESLQALLEPGRTYLLRVYSQGDAANVYQLAAAQISASVEDRHIFYNNSYFDGKNAAPNAADDGAIATDKLPLFPGEKASLVNYTSFSRGINGLMIDILNLADADALDAGSFEFRVGNNNDPAGWSTAPAPRGITVRTGAGQGGSDRVTLLWADNAIQKQWLQVTVLADDTTGLLQNDVFYFGNAVGESGNSATNTFVDGSDFAGARDNPHNFLNRAAIDDRFDYNRDSFVDGGDLATARDNNTNFLTSLRLIDLAGAAAGGRAAGEGEAANGPSWYAPSAVVPDVISPLNDPQTWPALREQLWRQAKNGSFDKLFTDAEKPGVCPAYVEQPTPRHARAGTAAELRSVTSETREWPVAPADWEAADWEAADWDRGLEQLAADESWRW